MAAFFDVWHTTPHPLGDLPLIVVNGTGDLPPRAPPPPGLPEAEWRSDTLRIDLSRLSSRGKLVTDSLSGHHVQLDSPALVIGAIRAVLQESKP
jgi:pimeloyl-ACP methyl ester carboxylesterase